MTMSAVLLNDSDVVALETSSMLMGSVCEVSVTSESISIMNFDPPSSEDVSLISSYTSIMTFLLALRDRPLGKSDLGSANLASFKHMVVQSLPVEFNGNCIFELPPLAIVKERRACRLDGMDQKIDCHVWTEIATSNISNPSGKLSFKYVKYMGHLWCTYPECHQLKECKDYNK